MICIIDYKMGNLHSVENVFKKLGADCTVSSSPEDIKRADKLILPGVGAFPDAVEALKEHGLFDVIIDECNNGKPLMGICLGMQLLFEKSYEFGESNGLGFIEGSVIPIDAPTLKIPHIGWNSVSLLSPDDKLMRGINEGDYVYFVHSFRANTSDENIVCYTTYGEKIPALVKAKDKNIWGAQFHPEKSHDVGLKILENFCKI